MTTSRGAQRLTVVPLSFADACAAVDRWHRHHRRPQGHKFSLGVLAAGTLVGAAIIGRPVARGFDTGWCTEVTRLATDGTPNACSCLYGAAWRTAKEAGYQRVITYTQEGESGSSLRAAGWQLTAVLRPRTGWDTPSRPRTDRGTDDIARMLWQQARTNAPPLPELTALRHEIRHENRCAECGELIVQRPGPGRPRHTCSDACRKRAQRRRNQRSSR
jgi:hypothetical protein